MQNDPYALLGVPRTATTDEIKKAYRKLARTNHPDLNPDNPDAEARFKAISAANDLLQNPETRARFDAGEIDGLGAERPQRKYYRDFADAPGNTYQQGRGFTSGGDPDDIFAEILRGRAGFGAQRGGAGRDGGFSAPGPDLRYALDIAFLDAVRGSQTQITLPDGQAIAVTIPQGTEDGQTLRLRGKGAPGFGGGPAGDALITISVRPHPVFRRDGDDIVLTLPITLDEAILGGKVTAPTIDGPVGLTIPAGASSGRILRLRGRGVTRRGKTKPGDQRVELRIVTPPEIDDSLRDFMAEWRKTHAHDPREELLKGAQT